MRAVRLPPLDSGWVFSSDRAPENLGALVNFCESAMFTPLLRNLVYLVCSHAKLPLSSQFSDGFQANSSSRPSIWPLPALVASPKKVILLPSSNDCTFSSLIGRHDDGIAVQLARMLYPPEWKPAL